MRKIIHFILSQPILMCFGYTNQTRNMRWIYIFSKENNLMRKKLLYSSSITYLLNSLHKSKEHEHEEQEQTEMGKLTVIMLVPEDVLEY